MIRVPSSEKTYSWYSPSFDFVDDDGNLIISIPRTPEIPMSQQKFSTIYNIRSFNVRKPPNTF